MNITRSIFNKLNESSEVKKTYGDKPQEGKSEKLQRGKTASVPKNKGVGKFKVEKLSSVNKEAGEIYVSDTDRVMDKIDSKEQSDKGKAPKTIGTKADKTIKYPFGDKVDTPSDNKLIKESEEVTECDGANCEKKELKEESYSYGAGLLKEIYYQYVDLGMEDEFFDDCYNKMDISEPELQDWYKMGECDKPVKECGTPIPDSSVTECDKNNK